MIIHNPILTGSFSVNGADLSTITGSVATSASFDARTTYLESTSSILTAASASQSVTSGSLVAASASLSATSGSLSAASGSFNTRVSALEVTGSALSSSLLTVSGSGYATSASLSAASGSFNSRTTTLETYTATWTATSASFARTGSNTFTAPQYVSDLTVANGFANSSASVYTDGGLLVAKDSYFSGSMFIKGNLTIYGTQSVAYITSSQLNIATNVITVNTATPSVRFGGLNVYDSGSTGTGATGSLFWDSQNNGWVYQRESGSTYSGGMLISGPRRALGTNLGDEQGLTACMIPVAQGGDHITSSLIYHDSTVTCIPTPVIGGSTACFAGTITGNGVTIGASDVRSSSGTLTLGGTSEAMRIVSSGNIGIGGAPSAYSMTSPFVEIKNACNNSAFIISTKGTTQLGGFNGNVFASAGTVANLGLFSDGGCIMFGSFINGYTSYTETMRITSGGNVGIGTTSPQARTDSYYLSGATSNLGDNIVLGVGTDGGVVGTFTQIGLGYHSRNAGNYFPAIIASVVENSSNQNAEGIVFATRSATTGTTRPTERMRITSIGGVAIGTSTVPTGWAFEVQANNGNGATSGAAIFRVTNCQGAGVRTQVAQFINTTGASAYSSYMYIGSSPGTDYKFGKDVNGTGTSKINITTDSNTEIFSLSVSGVLSTPGGGTSDCRVKQNIEYITDNAIEIINGLKPSKFQFKEHPTITRHGFIAQDVLVTKSDLVLGDEDLYGLDYDGILSIAVKAIQEQQCKIALLESCLGIS